MTSLLLCLTLMSAQCRTWVVNRPALEIVRGLQSRAPTADAHLPPELMLLAERMDPVITMYARPKTHYYRFTIQGQGRFVGIDKRLEVWGMGNRTKFRSTVDVSVGRERLPGRLIGRIAEETILDWEVKTSRK